MATEEQSQAVDALTAWFKSQDIRPREAISIMVMQIFVACIAICQARAGVATPAEIERADIQAEMDRVADILHQFVDTRTVP